LYGAQIYSPTIAQAIRRTHARSPLDQLCLSPQCGFASTAEGNLVTVDDQIAKLRLVVETVREVWG